MGNADGSGRGPSRALSVLAAVLGGLGLIFLILGLVGVLNTATPNMRGFNQGQSVSIGESGMSVWARSDDVREEAACTASGDQDIVLERPVAPYSVDVGGSEFFEVARTPADFPAGTYSITCEGTEEALYAGPRATRTVANGLMGQTGLLVGGILLASAALLGLGAVLSRGRKRQPAQGPYGYVDEAPAPYWQPQQGGYPPPGQGFPAPAGYYQGQPYGPPQGYAPQGYPGQEQAYGQQGYPSGGYEPPAYGGSPGYGQQQWQQPAQRQQQGPGQAWPQSEHGARGTGAPGAAPQGFPPPPAGSGEREGEDTEHTEALYRTGEHTQAFPAYGTPPQQDPYALPGEPPPWAAPPSGGRWDQPPPSPWQEDQQQPPSWQQEQPPSPHQDPQPEAGPGEQTPEPKPEAEPEPESHAGEGEPWLRPGHGREDSTDENGDTEQQR